MRENQTQISGRQRSDERAVGRSVRGPKLVSERENLEVQRRARRIKERSERSTATTIGIAAEAIRRRPKPQ